MYIKLSLIVLLILVCMPGCDNDIELLTPSREMPVVYCILNQNDSVHFVRLERSFAGHENAFVMARESDSIYYNHAEVYLEEWYDREYRSTIPFDLIDTIRRDSGIFAYHKNPIYAAKASLNGNSVYKLNIRIPDGDSLITAQTHLVDGIRIIKPEFTRPTIAFSAYNNYLNVEWMSAPYARIYFLQLRFNYLEVLGLDTITKSMTWNISHFVSEHAKGGKKMDTQILHENFYKWISAKFASPQKGIKRIATKKAIDLIFTVGGEELYTYMDVTNPNSSIVTERPVYTNISNGIGLLSARYEQEIKGKAMTYASIDSLSFGEITKGLGFVDSNDDYYIK
ncbi:MAG: DUF4249 family protein [Bacteroidetes bacterium]|nr:DUF4249 family protein [Bacteroidota bacterium]MBT4401756.1 DUF4249 family protein [Bacteroidota bacterium]MBT4410684.1 DUF4249 family protein [Bacteroidota bacterium]MBT5427723.1 DUF4249 family protein [Bacteroidota bacterium]MBT7093812.1 DUF4249 family protein [Bacteroidota bacterium]